MEICPGGTFAVTGASECTTCPAGKSSAQGATNCVKIVDYSSVGSLYPNTGDYYLDRVLNFSAQNSYRALHPDYHLGRITCPGKSVCLESWIGDSYCDDCFGCDQHMIMTGFYGDCSKCSYFWSGGYVGVGEFDGGDCGDFVFPQAVNEPFFDACLNKTKLRTTAQINALDFTQKRNTIIVALNSGGWGTIDDLQAFTDTQLLSSCEYVNIRQCLVKNEWYDEATMTNWTDGMLRFEAASHIDDWTDITSIDLVLMTEVDLLGQCVVAGIAQKLMELEIIGEVDRDSTEAWKRNKAIDVLSNLGFGTLTQMQTLSNAQIRFLMDHLQGSGLTPDNPYP